MSAPVRRAWPLLVAAAILALPSAAAAQRRGFDPDAVYAVPTGDAPAHGPADAAVTVVEFSDYACAYCARAQRTLDHVARLTGAKLRRVFRHLPLDDDETLAAEAALAAAAQGAFWPMHDRLFAVHGQVDRAAVELIAADLGLDLTRFRGDLDARVHRDRVLADAAAARRLGITGTPMFFVNGRPLRGAQPLGVFLRVVDEELARAGRAVADGAPPEHLYAYLTADGRAAADAADDLAPAPAVLDGAATYKVGLGLDGHAAGPDDALVTIVAWGDFQCPYCAAAAPLLARARAEWGDQVRIVFRHLPLPGHPDAQLAAEAAVAAAGQGRFWDLHDRLFAAGPRALRRADLERIARELGLDLPAFRAALDDRRHRDAVADDAAAAAALGVSGTPTLFVNGTPIEGAPRWDDLATLVRLKLDDARGLLAHGIAPGDVYGLIMAAARGSERGDPSRVPRTAAGARVELRGDDRVDAVGVACRWRDAARAVRLATRLEGRGRADARAACAAYGIDLE